MIRLSPGVVLAAADALRSGQQNFTAAQVAALIHLAYETGRRHGAAEDMAEVVACWHEFAEPRRTREERVKARLAEMEAYARQRAAREGSPYRPYPGGPVDWETGRPVRHLEIAA